MASPTPPGREPAAGPRVDDLVHEVERLRVEVEQLQRAVASHAVVDQAIGVLVTMAKISPQDGFTVLREVSQHTNTKLSSIAEQIIEHARGAALPETVLAELHRALARRR
ncbi:ANTAR domain-containing protein [Streptomyces sp. 5-8]|uniref:ANTAR domain-containing protein n=1 Tax=Streptomyces musisoli TaxID=2802280 RepID=A0ABS1NU34_9ACTN|nr:MULTISPECIES: ANTAR domain-containing protein [Streptomyces]MBL1103484.1 ANTAR domain-containing protein [Streptomyces musisoli]MBY8839910.1 ANTAR domain-containing protein [Streptomyces sp. SP2-10]